MHERWNVFMNQNPGFLQLACSLMYFSLFSNYIEFRKSTRQPQVSRLHSAEELAHQAETRWSVYTYRPVATLSVTVCTSWFEWGAVTWKGDDTSERLLIISQWCDWYSWYQFAYWRSWNWIGGSLLVSGAAFSCYAAVLLKYCTVKVVVSWYWRSHLDKQWNISPI